MNWKKMKGSTALWQKAGFALLIAAILFLLTFVLYQKGNEKTLQSQLQQVQIKLDEIGKTVRDIKKNGPESQK